MNQNPFESIDEQFNKIYELLVSIKENQKNGANDNIHEEFVRSQKAANILCISKSTLDKLVASRNIPYTKPKGSKFRLFKPSDLYEYLKNGRRKTKKELENEAVSTNWIIPPT